MQPLQSYALACALMTVSAAVSTGCGANGPDEDNRDAEALIANGSGGAGGAGGAGMGGDASTSSSTDSASSSDSASASSNSSGSSSTGASMGECNIMSSNTECADCLASKCCFVINECMDEAFLSCVSCIDSFLSGDADAFCEEGVGKNHWIVECVAFNCDTECAGS